VIVAWKTTANQYAKVTLSPLIGEHTTILTLQNGLGNCEHLANIFGAQRIIAGLCFVCINRLSPGVISHTAAGLIRIGEFQSPPSASTMKLVETFKAAKVPCEPVEVLEKALWMKLVWNIPFNGLAIAEGGVDTEVLLHDLNLEPKVRKIMHEIVSVAKKLGHTIPAKFIDQQIAITIPMKKYRPSSMIDFVEGRPVEYEAIWENPIKVALQVGIEIPEIQALAERIKTRISERAS